MDGGAHPYKHVYTHTLPATCTYVSFRVFVRKTVGMFETIAMMARPELGLCPLCLKKSGGVPTWVACFNVLDPLVITWTSQ